MSRQSFDVPNWEEIRTQIVTANNIDPALVAMHLADRYDLYTLITIRERVIAELAGKAQQSSISEILGGSEAFAILQIAIALQSYGREYRRIGEEFLGKEEP